MALLSVGGPLSFIRLGFGSGEDPGPPEQLLTMASHWPAGHLLMHWGGEPGLRLTVPLWHVEKAWSCPASEEQGHATSPQGSHYDWGAFLCPFLPKNIFTTIGYKCVSMKRDVIFDPKSLWGVLFWFYKKWKPFWGSLKILGDPLLWMKWSPDKSLLSDEDPDVKQIKKVR